VGCALGSTASCSRLGIETQPSYGRQVHVANPRDAFADIGRSFLCNHAQGIAAIDMFVVASISFRLLCVMIILGHGSPGRSFSRRSPEASHRRLALASGNRSVPMGYVSALSAA